MPFWLVEKCILSPEITAWHGNHPTMLVHSLTIQNHYWLPFFRTCATNIQGKWKEENGSWHAKWERHEGEWQEQRHFPLVFPAFWSSVSTNTYDILMFVYWDILHLYGGILTGGHSNLCCTELLFFTFFYPFKVSGRPYIYIHIKYIYIYKYNYMCTYI